MTPKKYKRFLKLRKKTFLTSDYDLEDFAIKHKCLLNPHKLLDELEKYLNRIESNMFIYTDEFQMLPPYTKMEIYKKKYKQSNRSWYI